MEQSIKTGQEPPKRHERAPGDHRVRERDLHGQNEDALQPALYESQKRSLVLL